MWVVCPELRIKALNQQDTMSVEITHRLDLLQVDLRSFLASGASFLGQASYEVAGGFESLPIAPCTEIRIAHSGKFLLMEFGIQETFARGVPNSALWNLEIPLGNPESP